jgi:outer membrane protein assembly factor BamB
VVSWHDGTGATVRAFDARTGTLRWETPAGVMGSAPVLAPGTVLFAEGEGVHAARVRALDLRTGQERWQVPLAGWWDDELEAAVDPTTAYLLDGMGTVVALDLETGAVRWRRETGRPLVDGRVVLTPDGVVFASYDDELLVIDRETGRLRAVEPQRGVPVDIAAAGDRLVVALRLGAPSRVEARPEP